MNYLILFVLFMTYTIQGCSHNYHDEIEEQLSSQTELPFPKPANALPYTKTLSEVFASPQKRLALFRIREELAGDLMVLKIRQERAMDLLTKELLTAPYNRQKVAAIMRIIIKDAKKEASMRLTSMLKAKNVLRYGLTKEQLRKVRTNEKVVDLLRSQNGAF